ncbi:MAG: MBL fold metallo-hydrolase [Proteobacteria bacterium]|nr:MBL fold metallo-hydrolase [Pseudomonadota bacterium]
MRTLDRRHLITGTLALAGAGLPALSAPAQGAPRAPTLPVSRTEEGQSVIYDAYTWQRRELTKKLPLGEPWPREVDIAAAFRRFGLDQLPAFAPAALPVPSTILPDVYLVNSTPNLAYLVDGGPEGLILVDPGLETNVEAILKATEALGFKRSAIRWVINTHAHFDHSWADAHFQKLGARILIGRADAPAVEKGTQITAKFALGPKVSADYPTLKVDWPVDDGEELRLGNKMLVAIATPGHTPGSTCYWMQLGGKNVLFGGDTLLFDYRLGAQALAYSDNPSYLRSLHKVARFASSPGVPVRWDILLPGHGTISLDRADMDVMKGVRQVQWDIDMGEQIKALPFADDDYRKLMFGRP